MNTRLLLLVVGLCLSTFLVQAQWSVAHLSQARSRAFSVVTGHKALFIGGETQGGYSNVVDMYDSVTGLWDTLYSPGSHQLNPVISIGNKVFFAGGINNFAGEVDIYDVSSGTWSSGGYLSVQRYYAAGASVGNKVLIAGGTGNSDVVDIYSLPVSGVSQLAPGPMSALFPNPADQAITARFNQPVSGIFSLANADGRVVRRETIQQVESVHVTTADLPAGLYVWKWTSTTGADTSVGKVLVLH